MKKCNECGSENADNLKYCRYCGYELPKPKVEEVQSSVQKPIKKVDSKKLAGIIVGAIAFMAAYFLVQQLVFNPSIDKVLMKSASEINKSCPIMIDSETRLDNTIVLLSKVFQYNYTLVNMEKETVDIAALKDYLEPSIINFVRTNPEMKFQRDKKITVNYYYQDKDRNYLFTISVTPEQYE
jgi:ribosomal protein L40E